MASTPGYIGAYAGETAVPPKDSAGAEFLNRLDRLRARLGELAQISAIAAEKIAGAEPEATGNIKQATPVGGGFFSAAHATAEELEALVATATNYVNRIRNSF